METTEFRSWTPTISTSSSLIQRVCQGNLIALREYIHVANNCVYVSDCDNDRIAVFQLSGEFLTSFGKEGRGRGEFRHPHGIVFDCDGFLYVCDRLNHHTLNIINYNYC